MHRIKLAQALVLVAGLSGISNSMVAQETTETKSVKPDNTKKNKRDRAKGEPTADQQKENTSDRDITKKIRRSIVTDKSLSTYAHNIKIITQGGMVTLKGPVHTADEKKAVEAKAVEVAGADKVHNEISVTGDKK